MQRKHPLRSRSSDPTPDTAAPPCCCQVGAARAARQQRGCLAGGRPSLGEEAALRHNRLQAGLQSLAVAVAVDTLQVLHHPYPEAAVEVDSHSGLRCRPEGLQIPEVAACGLQRPSQEAEAAEDRARRRVPCLAAEEAAGQGPPPPSLVVVVVEEGLGRVGGREEVEARREALLQSLEVAVVAASQDLVEVVAA